MYAKAAHKQHRWIISIITDIRDVYHNVETCLSKDDDPFNANMWSKDKYIFQSYTCFID